MFGRLKTMSFISASAPQIQLWCWHCAPYKCSYYYYYYYYYFTQIERHFVLRRPFLYMFDFSSSCNVTIFRYQKRGIICEFYDNEWQTDRQTDEHTGSGLIEFWALRSQFNECVLFGCFPQVHDGNSTRVVTLVFSRSRGNYVNVQRACSRA